MQVSKAHKATSADGHTLYCFRITNATGAFVELTNRGARWLSAFVPDRHGNLGNVLLAPDDFLSDPYYMGATVGRVANRIGGARIVVDGKTYLLDKNDNENCNHGGFDGFDKKVWDWQILDCGVRFSRLSPDGEGGFPGNVKLEVEYTWSDDNELTIAFRATTDAATCLNLTNHAYFNLSAGIAPDVKAHLLQIPANRMLDTTPQFIPTGEIVEVSGTPFDFTAPKAIGRDMSENDRQLIWNRGYNHCYILKTESDSDMVVAAHLSDPLSGRMLTVRTDQNAVLLYSAGYYPRPSAAVCLETQNWPDAANHPDFPPCTLSPGETYRQRTTYKFQSQS